MHRPALSRTERCTRPRRTCGWSGTLKNGLSWNWPPRCRTAGDRQAGARRRRRRRFIDWSRPGLRYDHPRPRSLRTRRLDWSRRPCNLTCWNRWSGAARSGWSRRSIRNRRNHAGDCRCRRDSGLRHNCNGTRWFWRRCWNGRPRRRDWRCWNRSHWFSCRGYGGLGLNWRRRYRTGRRRRLHRGCGLLLLSDDGFQYISGFRDVRKINLCLDALGLGTARTSGLCTRTLTGSPEMRSDLFGFVLFQRTGMRLLLGDPDFGEHIENGFAFYFQLPGQIVDSNLTHSPLCSSNSVPLSLHCNLTENQLLASNC